MKAAENDEGNKVVEECKTNILEGRKKVFEYLSKLKGDNEDLGRSLAKEISKKFDGLEDFVDKKKEELGQKLCQMRDAAVAKIDALIEDARGERWPAGKGAERGDRPADRAVPVRARALRL